MTTATRFKLVVNNTTNQATPITASNVGIGDGSERASRVIKRTLVAADVGTAAGQTQHALGCIIDTLQAGPNIGGSIQPGVNILNLSGASWKQVAAAGGRPIAYKRLDNLVTADAANIANLQYFFYPTDNTIRVYDAGDDNAIRLQAGDYVEVELVFGPN